MNRNAFLDLSALAAGLLFGLGLVVSGMTRPEKVLGFLDVFGEWDPSLMFVMIGAIAVHRVAYRLIRRRGAPLFAPKFVVPTRRDLDAKLLFGAAVFGAGWGLGGYCPGPGIVSLPGGGMGAVVFVLAMVGGMLATGKLDAARDRKVSERDRNAPTDRSHAGVTPEPIVLDVRTREEFASAHVPGAKNIPVQELAERSSELGATTTPIVVYCRSGARSATAAQLLKNLGFLRVTDIGAMSNWRAH